MTPGQIFKYSSSGLSNKIGNEILFCVLLLTSVCVYINVHTIRQTDTQTPLWQLTET